MRRELILKTIPELEQELTRLEKSHGETTGLWSFAQILNHLALSAEWMNGENFNLLPETVPAFERPDLGRKFFERMVRSGKMPSIQNSAAPMQREEGDWKKELDRLRSALQRFKTNPGKAPIHFVFGELTHFEWEQWIAIHGAHHLSYVAES